MILLQLCKKFFFNRPVNTDKPNFVSLLVFAGAAASFTASYLSIKLSRNEKPFWISSQNSEYPRIFPVTGANQNARKSLSTDLVKTDLDYSGIKQVESARFLEAHIGGNLTGKIK